MTQKDTVKLLLRHPDTWIPFNPADLEAVEMVCALANLGIAKLKSSHAKAHLDQFKLKSKGQARRFLFLR